MIEASLRKWHRWLGLGLVVFVILQAVTGLTLTLSDLIDIGALDRWCSLIHRGGGDFGVTYRILLAMGLLFMAFSGILIFIKIRQRTRKR